MGVHLDLDDVVANQPVAAQELAELRSERDQYKFLLNYAINEMKHFAILDRAVRTIELHMEGYST